MAIKPRRPLLRDALVIFGVAWFLVGWFVIHYDFDFLTDARAYFNGALAPYQGTVGTKGVFTYMPPLANAFAALAVIPQPVVLAAWFALNVGVTLWLLRGQWLVGLMLAMPIADALATGQIELLMAAAVVVSLRWPATWALPLLAKSTTGVGLLWYVVRREWRQLFIALVIVAAICAVSFAVAPGLWSDWLVFLTRHTVTAGQLLPVRLASAAVLVVWGARTDRLWVLPAAVVLALPVLYIHSLAMLLGVGAVRLQSQRQPAPVPTRRLVAVGPGPVPERPPVAPPRVDAPDGAGVGRDGDLVGTPR